MEEVKRMFDPRKWTLREKFTFATTGILSLSSIIFVTLFLIRSENVAEDIKSLFISSKEVTASCAVRPDPTGPHQGITGMIRFTQKSGKFDKMKIDVNITGLPRVTSSDVAFTTGRGMHVHTFGDLEGGCGTTTGHYNPKGVSHKGPSVSVRHPGDFGNFKQVGTKITRNWEEPAASLFGAESILGRSMVLHGGQDDLGLGGDAGSRASGNAGARLACCVIGWEKP